MLGVLVISIPLLIYLIGALSVKKKDLTHPDEFFVAYRKVGTTAFSSSSIAYAFQVSTIYPFLLWGASNFYFVPAANTICWGAGIVLFYLCFDRYKHFIGQDVTLHGFLGNQYGKSVRVVASYLTIIAFLGYALAETYFGSKVLLSIIEDRNLFYVTVALSLLFVYGYIAYGGQLSSIRTDQLQLVISYAGIFGLMLYLLYVLPSTGKISSGALNLSFTVLLIYIPIILIIRKLQFIRFSEEDTKTNKLINVSLNCIITILLVSILVVALHKSLGAGFQFGVAGLINLEGFGIPGLLSLMILPLAWQFVDLTNWQRLLAVKPSNSNGTESLHRNIRRGLVIYAIESPFTWLIFIFFGLLTITALPNFTFQDLLVDIPKTLISSQNILQQFFGYTFIVSVLAIMLSTVDSFLVGTIFTFVYDSHPQTRALIDSKNRNEIKSNYSRITNVGRLFGLTSILGGVALFVIFDKSVANGGELFINLLLAFYSAQLSFLPLVFGTLFLKRHLSEFWANASMVIGAVAGISLGIYAVIWNPAYAWYPILVSTSLSSFVFAVGFLLKADYMEKRRFSSIILVLAVILAMTKFSGLSKAPAWKNWEFSALFSTLCYTIYIYYEAIFKKKILDNIKGSWGFLLGFGFVSLLLLTLIEGNEVIHLFNFRMNIAWTLFVLVLITGVFSVIDYIFSKSLKDSMKAISHSYRLSFWFSDLPIFLAFTVLTIYCVILVASGNLSADMDAFFGGAIAFQMITSNVIWTFLDRPFFANNK
jgi:hypothetical protein